MEGLAELVARPAVIAALLMGVLAGTIRGITGFGAAMVLIPPLALLVGPRVAVPVTLLLETFAVAPMLPQVVRNARWPVLLPISAAAIVCVPLGSYVLLNADPQALRRAIAATVILFALLLMRGASYAGPQRLLTAVGVGGLSGTLLGATGIGGPPVILYLLAGPDPAQVSRANLTLYIIVISAAGLLAIGAHRGLGADVLQLAVLMALPFMAGVVVGSHLFARFSTQGFRRFTLALMLGVSVFVFFA